MRSAAWLVLVLSCAACSSSESPKPCVAYVVPPGLDLQNPKVSFKADVLPTFVQACAFSSCHGSASGNNNGVYLGSKSFVNDASAIRAGIVDVSAPENPTMQIVSAGDPTASYLMHKLDGDQCRFAKDCATVENCGTQMPHDSDALDVDTRDKIRRWIAQGAPDN